MPRPGPLALVVDRRDHVLDEETRPVLSLERLARGAPYFSVLTEDLGRIVPGDCACGRSGRRFELLGRVPKAEIRGCANV